MGVYFGTGKQYYSWIHLDDLCNLFIYALEKDNLQGVYNAVAPNPVTNYEYTRAIAVALNRPALLVSAPAFAMRLAMGEMAHIVLDSAYASSEKIEQTGFQFQYPVIGLALRAIYK